MEHARGTGVREGMENDHPGRVAMWRRESRVCSRGRAPRDRPVATPDSLRAHRASRSLRSGSWRSPVRRPLIVRTPSRRAPPASTQTKSSLCPAHRRATALRPDPRESPNAACAPHASHRPAAPRRRRSWGPPDVSGGCATWGHGGGARVARTCAAATRWGVRWRQCRARRLDRGRARGHGPRTLALWLAAPIHRTASHRTHPTVWEACLSSSRTQRPGFRLRPSVKLCVVPSASISKPHSHHLLAGSAVYVRTSYLVAARAAM